MHQGPIRQGSCHCGTIRYEISGPIQGITHCHCRTCRKVGGTVFASGGAVATDHFRLTAGAADLRAYESSPGKKRHFCSRCGSPIFARLDANPGVTLLRIGSLDDDPGVVSARHIWVSHSPRWYQDRPELPRFPEGPPPA